MVGKKNPPGSSATSSKRSPVASEPALANRPRRNISPKNLDLTAGLSWREERELKKALYASLQETKKCTAKSDSVTMPTPPPTTLTSTTRRSQGSTTVTHTVTRRQSPRASKPVFPLATSSHIEIKPVKTRNTLGVDESSQDSTVSSQTSVSCSTEDSRSKTKVRAQRKFAQMMAYGNTMVPQLMTPVKQSTKASPIKVFPKRAKTEDFLTFLCLRGTQVLPPHLDFFNFSRDDGDSSCPATPSNGGHPSSSTRESSPCSSSTSTSNVDFDNFLGRVTPIRKAARACAGTPETARGLASIGSGARTRNGSPLISRKRQRNNSPAITPSKSSRSTSSPQKLSHGKGISPSKVGSSDRLSSKKKALATLRASKMSPITRKDRKKSLFPDSRSVTTATETRGMKVMSELEIEHFVCSRGVIRPNTSRPGHTYLGLACDASKAPVVVCSSQFRSRHGDGDVLYTDKEKHAPVYPIPTKPHSDKPVSQRHEQDVDESSAIQTISFSSHPVAQNPTYSTPADDSVTEDSNKTLESSSTCVSFSRNLEIDKASVNVTLSLTSVPITTMSQGSICSPCEMDDYLFLRPRSVSLETKDREKQALMKSIHLVEKCPIRAGTCIHPQPAPPYSAIKSFATKKSTRPTTKENVMIDKLEDSGIQADLSVNDSLLEESVVEEQESREGGDQACHTYGSINSKTQVPAPSADRHLDVPQSHFPLLPLPPSVMSVKLAPSFDKTKLTSPLEMLMPSCGMVCTMVKTTPVLHMLTPPLDLLTPASDQSSLYLNMPSSASAKSSYLRL